MAYATPQQLKQRYPDLSSVSDETMLVKLSDASLVIKQRLKRRRVAEESVGNDVLAMVCCNVAARTLYPSHLGSGLEVSQLSTTVGSISEQVTFSGSRGGNCRLLESDLQDLGIAGGRAGSFDIGGA